MTPGPPGRVRIVAGAKRGRRLRVAPDRSIRPTSEKVREAIFDVLGPIAGLTVVDLFAGTGAMGLEALSRGVSRCVFVESDAQVADVLKDNIEALEYGPVSRVLTAGYETAARALVQDGGGFDLLFVDPPYRMLAEVEVMLTPLMPGLLSADGVAVIESDGSTRVTFGYTPVFERTYGGTKVTMIAARRSLE